MPKFDLRKRLGALPSPWDNKRLMFTVRHPTFEEAETLPEEYDGLLKYHDTENWYDQGNVGSCVGWCNSIAMEVTDKLMGVHIDNLSAGWIYVRSRFYAGVNPFEDGSTNLGAMKALNHEGSLAEAQYPTDVKSPFEEESYPQNWENVAATHAITSYHQVPITPADFKAAIYGITHPAPYKMPDGSLGKIPLVTAFPVYESFRESYTNGGIVPEVNPFGLGEKLLGGHSSLLRGWKVVDGKKYYRNTGSWGKDIGDKGTFYLPENYPFWDAWVIHNGPPVPDSNPPDSDCTVAKAWTGIYNTGNSLIGGKTRLKAVVPRRLP